MLNCKCENEVSKALRAVLRAGGYSAVDVRRL